MCLSCDYVFAMPSAVYLPILLLCSNLFVFRWFEFIYYQLEFDGKVIASGDTFGLSDTKEVSLPGP